MGREIHSHLNCLLSIGNSKSCGLQHAQHFVLRPITKQVSASHMIGMQCAGGNLWFRVRMLWLANTSNLILNFTYLKAALLALWRAILCKNLEFKATGEVAQPGKKSRARHFCSFQWWSIR